MVSIKKIKYKKFIILGILTEIIYLLFYFIEPLKLIFNDTGIVPRSINIFLIVVILLLFALFFYILAFKKIDKYKINIKYIIAFSILFNITLLFIWPIGSIDMFSYIYRARIFSEYNLNPYLVAYSSLNNDSFYYFINNLWSSKTTLYGPLFIIISGALSFIGGNNLIFTIFLFKGFFILINIFNCYLIYKIFNSKKAVLLYSWNPLILYEFAINGHNDVLTIFFILLSLYFILKSKKYFFSLFFLTLSILIKFISAIFLPIFLLIIFLKFKSKKEKIYFVLASCLIIFLTFFIFYLPFWEGTQTFSRLLKHSNNSYGTVLFFSPLMLFFTSLLYFLDFKNYMNFGAICSKLFFLFSYLILIIKIFLDRQKIKMDNIIKYFIISLGLFYFSFFNWLMPWYFTVLIALLAGYYTTSKSKNKIKIYTESIIYFITFYGIVYYIILR